MAPAAAEGRIHRVGGERQTHQRPVLMSAPKAGRNYSPQRHGRIEGMSSYSVRRSRVHGRGLFARPPYMPGDLVGEYRGRAIDGAFKGGTSRARNSDPYFTVLFGLAA